MTKVTNWLSYQPRASAMEPATIQIFDQIGEDWFGGSGLSAKAFSQTLQDVGPGPWWSRSTAPVATSGTA